MQALFNGAAAGTNGTTCTGGSGGNTGGGSGAFFDTVQIGASATVAFDNTHPAHDTLGYKFQTGASSVQANLQWQGSITAVATIWFRLYIFTPSSFATTPTIVRMLDSTNTTQAVRFAWNASGNVLIRNTANTTVATSTNTMTTSTMYRLEGFCTQGASSTAEVKIFSSIESTTPLETLTITAQNFGTNNIGTVIFGQSAALANMPAWWADEIAITDGGYLGPWQPPMVQSYPARRRWFMPWVHRNRPLVIADQPVVFPAKASRSRIVRPVLRSKASGPVPTTTTVVPPPLPPQPVHRLRWALGRIRGRHVTPVPPQFNPPYQWQPVRRGAKMFAPRKGKHVTPVPPQFNPPYQWAPVRRGAKIFGRLRGKHVTPVPPQFNPPYQWQPVRRPAKTFGRLRGKHVTPVPPQFNPPYQWQPVRRPAKMFGRMRGRHVTPVPPQFNPPYQWPPVRRASKMFAPRKGRHVSPTPPQFNPPYQWAPVHRLRWIPKWAKGRASMPVPPQQPLVPPPPYVSLPVHGLRLVLGRIRGRHVTPVPPQFNPPYQWQPVRRPARIFGRLRGRSVGITPPQGGPPPPYPVAPVHRLRQVIARIRSRISRPPVPQQDPTQEVRRPQRFPVQRSPRSFGPPPSSTVLPPPPLSRPRRVPALFKRRSAQTPIRPVIAPFFLPRRVRGPGRFFPPRRHQPQFLPTQTPPPRNVDLNVIFDIPGAKWDFSSIPLFGRDLPQLFGAPVRTDIPQDKWEIGSVYDLGPLTREVIQKWYVGIGGPLLALSSASLEYVRVPVTASAQGVFVNPTSDVVQMAFLTSNANPGVSDWQSAVWDAVPLPTNTYVAQCLVGPGGTITLAVGTYNVWIKIIDNPEIVVRSVGIMQVT